MSTRSWVASSAAQQTSGRIMLIGELYAAAAVAICLRLVCSMPICYLTHVQAIHDGSRGRRQAVAGGAAAPAVQRGRLKHRPQRADGGPAAACRHLAGRSCSPACQHALCNQTTHSTQFHTLPKLPLCCTIAACVRTCLLSAADQVASYNPLCRSSRIWGSPSWQALQRQRRTPHRCWRHTRGRPTCQRAWTHGYECQLCLFVPCGLLSSKLKREGCYSVCNALDHDVV